MEAKRPSLDETAFKSPKSHIEIVPNAGENTRALENKLKEISNPLALFGQTEAITPKGKKSVKLKLTKEGKEQLAAVYKSLASSGSHKGLQESIEAFRGRNEKGRYVDKAVKEMFPHNTHSLNEDKQKAALQRRAVKRILNSLSAKARFEQKQIDNAFYIRIARRGYEKLGINPNAAQIAKAIKELKSQERVVHKPLTGEPTRPAVSDTSGAKTISTETIPSTHILSKIQVATEPINVSVKKPVLYPIQQKRESKPKKKGLARTAAAIGVFGLGLSASIPYIHTRSQQPPPVQQTEEKEYSTEENTRVRQKSTESAAQQKELTNVFDEVLKPFIETAFRKRAERMTNDTEYAHRVDTELNKDRINFVLFGYGETFEPPAADKVIVGSHTIVSYDIKTKTFNMVSLTRDLRAPEIERFLENQGKKTKSIKIDQAYPIGGFDLQRKTLEDATGLSVDFQIAMQDNVIKKLTDYTLGELEVDIPYDFDALPFYLDSVQYQGGHFSKGKQKLTGLQIIQFTKSIAGGEYDANKERSVRKHIVINALLSQIIAKQTDVSFLLKLGKFVTELPADKTINADFDFVSLIGNSIFKYVKQKGLSLFSPGASEKLTKPNAGKSIALVDAGASPEGGGLQWSTASTSPKVQKDLKEKKIEDPSTEVPTGEFVDPYAQDLISGYWPEARQFVKNKLTIDNPQLQDKK